MNIKEQKIELNKTDIYEDVRRDINRRQTVHSNKSANYRSGTPEMPDRRKKCIVVMTTTTTTTATRQGCQLTTIIFTWSVFLNITTPSTITRSYRSSRGWRKRMRCYRTKWQGWGRWGNITDWKITGRTSRIWNRELMSINSGWEAIHKINIKI